MIDSVNIYSSVSVYAQIENLIQFRIASGRLKPGERLPSVRELSEKLGVNPNTVAKAYRDLEVMGLLYTRRGMGVYVRAEGVHRGRVRVREQLATKIFEVVGEARASGMKKTEVQGIVGKAFQSNVEPYSEALEEALEEARK